MRTLRVLTPMWSCSVIFSFFILTFCKERENQFRCIGIAVQDDIFDINILGIATLNSSQAVLAKMTDSLVGHVWKVYVEHFRTLDKYPVVYLSCAVLLLFVSCDMMHQLVGGIGSSDALFVVPEPCPRPGPGPGRVGMAVLPQYSPQSNIAQLLIDCLRQDGLTWKSAWIVYDERYLHDDGLDTVMTYFKEQQTLLGFFKIPENSNTTNASILDVAVHVVEVLAANSNHRERNVILLCHRVTTSEIIKQAQSRLPSMKTTWMIIDFNDYPHDHQHFLETLGTFLTNTILIRGLPPITDTEFYLHSIKSVYNAILSTLIETVQLSFSDRLPSPMGSRRRKALLIRQWSEGLDRLDWPSGFDVSSFWLDNSRVRHWLPANLWRIGPGFSASASHLYPYKRRLLEHVHVRAFTFHHPPWQMFSSNCSTNSTTMNVDPYGEDVNPNADGVALRLFELLRRKLKFTVSFACLSLTSETPFQHWERQWMEAVKMLQENKADVVVSAVAITEERADLVEFSSPFHREPYAILSVKPGERSKVTLALDPFRTEVWMCIVSLVAIVGATLLCASSLQRSLGHPQWSGGGLLLAFAILIQQGKVRLAPALWSSHMLLALWLLGAVVISNMFICNLVAQRAVPRIAFRIDSVEQLLAANATISWGVLRASPVHVRLNFTIDKRLAAVRDHSVIHDDFDESVLREVRSGTHVLLASKTVLLNVLQQQHNKTSVYEFVFGEDLFFDKIAFAFRKGYPFLAAMDLALNKIVNAGLVRKWKTQLLPFVEHSYMKPNTPAHLDQIGIDIYGIQSALYVLSGGTLISVIVCLIERFFVVRSSGNSVRPGELSCSS